MCEAIKRTIDSLVEECKGQATSEKPLHPIALTGEPGSGKGYILENVLGTLSEKVENNNQSFLTIGIEAHAKGVLSVMRPEASQHAALVGITSRWLQLFANILAIAAPLAGPASAGVAVGAATLGSIGTGLSVAETIIENKESDAMKSQIPKTSPLGDFIVAVNSFSEENPLGLVFVISGAEYLSSERMLLAINHLQLASRTAKIPVVILLGCTSSDLDAIQQMSGKTDHIEFPAPKIDAIDVQQGWHCSQDLAEDVVSLTGGRAGLILDLQQEFTRLSLLPPAPPGRPNRVVAWLRGYLQELVEASLADHGISDPIRIIACCRALELISCVGGAATAEAFTATPGISNVANDLRFVCASGESHQTSWRVLTFAPHTGIFTITPLAQRAFLRFVSWPLSITQPKAATSEAYEANTFLEAWVESTATTPELLNTSAASFAAAIDRNELATCIHIAMEKHKKQKAAFESQNLTENLQREMYTADSQYLLVSSEQLRYLASNASGIDTRPVLKVAAEALRRARMTMPEATQPLLGTLVDLCHMEAEHSRTPFRPSTELSLLLANHDTPLIKHVLLHFFVGYTKVNPKLALQAAVHAIAESAAHGWDHAADALLSLWCAKDVLQEFIESSDRSRATEAVEIKGSILHVHHALACGNETYEYLSSHALLNEAYGSVNAGELDVEGTTRRALIRGWDYTDIAYKALCLFMIMRCDRPVVDQADIIMFAPPLISKAEKVAPLEEAAWWAYLAQIVAKQGSGEEAKLIYAMACALTNNLGDFTIPHLLRERLHGDWIPKELPAFILLNDGTRMYLTGGHRDGILRSILGLGREQAVNLMEKDWIAKSRELGAHKPCDEHSAFAAINEELRDVLLRMASFSETEPFNNDVRAKILLEIAGQDRPEA